LRNDVIETVLLEKQIFWDLVLCRLVVSCRRLARTYSLHFRDKVVQNKIFYLEDKGTKIHLNVRNFYQSTKLVIFQDSNIRTAYLWTSEDKEETPVDFRQG
jgi:hypothetical protein